MYLSDEKVLEKVKNYITSRGISNDLKSLETIEVLETCDFEPEEFKSTFDELTEIKIPEKVKSITTWLLSSIELNIEGELILPDYLSFASGVDDDGEYICDICFMQGTDGEGFELI